MAKEVFDPYRKWLGIPPSEQPPTHYRLLAIAEFEDDPDVIANAADRCMAHVRTFQSGAKSAHSQRLLNELSEARLTLLDPAKKQAYDDQLREAKAAAGPPPGSLPGRQAEGASLPQGVPVAVAQDSAPATRDSGDMPAFRPRSTTSAVRTRARRKSSPVPILLGIFAVLILGVILIVAMSSGGNSGDGRKSNSPPSRTSRVTPPRPTPAIKPPRDRRPPLPDQRPDSSPEDPPSTETEQPPATDAPQFGTIDQGVEQIRAALVRGDVAAATALLDAAAKLAQDDAERQRIDQWKQVGDHLQAFHWMLNTAANGLRPGAELMVPGREGRLVFQRSEATTPVTLHFAGRRPLAFKLDELPPRLAVAIVEEHPTPDPKRDLYIAAYLALHPRGDRAEAARRLAAAQAIGLADVSLAALLNLPKATGEADDSAPADDDPQVAGRLPVPDRDTLRDANGLLRDRYGSAILAAKTTDEKATVTKTIFQAAEEADDPAFRYALLNEAINQTTDLLNVQALLLMIDQLAEDYEVDGLDLKSLQLRRMAGNTTTDQQNSDIYAAAMKLLPDARADSRYGVAYRLASAASNAARRKKDWQAFRELDPELERFKALDTQLVRAAQARSVLDENPEDPAANTQVGLAECFVLDNWSGGLPLLAKGDDAALAEAAQQDLTMPTEPMPQAELAEQWFVLAKRKGGVIKPGMLRRAAYWYDRASENLTGPGLEMAKQKLAEIETLLAE